VSGVLEVPHTAGAHPGVILLPGSFGWRPGYAELARQFAASGFVALALDYYAETGAPADSEATRRTWPRWQATVHQAAAYLQQSPAVASRRIALVGFSQGASLAVSAAASTPAVGAVVAFYGGGGAGIDSLTQEVKKFPPLLILHGDADTTVPVSSAHRLRDAVIAHGGEVEMHIYSGAKHGFNLPGIPAYSEEAALDGWRRTAEFLHRRLGG
jgi:carboxymethylenebutenolidase